MVKQTINLLIRATIVGILINIAVEQVPTVSMADTVQDQTVLIQEVSPDPDSQ